MGLKKLLLIHNRQFDPLNAKRKFNDSFKNLKIYKETMTVRKIMMMTMTIFKNIF